ncbi:MAG: hypothetical protein IJW46_04115 [Clostridia bacterium]|nr:hypothetical protein [Clostridia bacterium]
MKQQLRAILTLLLALLLLVPMLLVGCGDGETTTALTSDDVKNPVTSPGTTTQQTATETTPETTDEVDPITTPTATTAVTDPITPPVTEPDEAGVDLVLFIGQSNMAGRGNAADATVVPEGHAYEFRAISDPTKLYPVTEPFGVNENNAASGVTENKKTGSLVSAFCESYYQATGTPIVAVSCAKGGEQISFFDVGTEVYDDAVERVKAAKAFLKAEYESGKEAFKLKNTYVVFLQGESDGDKNVAGDTYTEALARIVEGFKEDIGASETFVIPIGTYNGSDGSRRAKYNTIRDAQILFCEDSEDATVLSLILPDLHRYGYMKDEFHFNQAGYELIGKDAGNNMAYFVKNGKKPDCQRYYEEEEIASGAFLEKDGKVVINASSALELSPYAAYSSAGANLSFAAAATTLDGIEQTPSFNNFWEANYAFAEAPQLHYTVKFETTGRYYLYFLSSHPNTTSNSVYVSLDSGALVACTDSRDIVGEGRWSGNTLWYVDVETPGEHTVTVFVREDGVLLHQIVLSTSEDESFTDGSEETVSERGTAETTALYREVDGEVTVNLVDALRNGKYAYTVSGRANNIAHDFIWERSVAYPGIQIYPDSGVQWATNNISPKASYVIDFSTPGEYYVSLMTSFKSATADSVFISVDGGAIIALTDSIAVGPGKMLQHETWKITIPYAGEHTINLYAREDGAILHTMRLVHTEKEEKLAVKTLVLGDSYTSKTSWQHFDRQMNVLDAVTIGVGGTETGDWFAAMSQLTLYDPENIVLHIGVNDIDRGKAGSVCGYDVIAVIEGLQELFPNATVYYVTVCDNERFPDKWEEYAVSNAIVADYAIDHDNLVIVDFAAAMKEAGKDMANMGFRDQLHLNEEGYALLSEMLVEAIQKD